MGIAALRAPAGLHGGLGATVAVCPAPERDVAERAKLTLSYRETADQTAVEIMRLVLADETTPVPRREIVVPLFDNNNIFDHRKKEGK
jgi:hypothetical protein